MFRPVEASVDIHLPLSRLYHPKNLYPASGVATSSYAFVACCVFFQVSVIALPSTAYVPFSAGTNVTVTGTSDTREIFVMVILVAVVLPDLM